MSSEGKTKNITFGFVVSWIFGVLIGITGVMTLFKSPVSGVLFILASLIVLPPVNKYMKEKMHFSLSGVLKFFIVIIILGIAGSQMGSSAKSEVTESSSNTEVQTPTVKVTALQMVSDYKANEVSADAKYKGKTVEISGTVSTIGKDIMDTPYISLKTSEYDIINQVQCMFGKGDEAELANVSKGDSISLKGEVSGKLGNIIIRGCQIVK